MSGKLLPLGYLNPKSLERVEALMLDEHVLLVDIRYRPWSQQPRWRKENLTQHWGKRYRPVGGLWGNVNYNNDQPIKLAAPYSGLKVIRPWLEEGHDLILMCACKDYTQCHRKTVVEYIKEQMPEVEVILD